jgi:hypothetical protein
MGYYTSFDGEFVINPPLMWAEVRSSRFGPDQFEKHRLDVKVRVGEAVVDDDEGTRITRTGVALMPAYEDEMRGYNIVEHVQLFMDEHPGHELVGRLDCRGDDRSRAGARRLRADRRGVLRPAARGTTLSSTGARELLKPGGPARFRHAIDNGTLEVRREFDLGHAVHTRVLGRARPRCEFQPRKWRSKAVKEEVAAVRAAGMVPLRPSDYEASVRHGEPPSAHPIARKLLTDGQPERP